jgi:hypothetical protein
MRILQHAQNIFVIALVNNISAQIGAVYPPIVGIPFRELRAQFKKFTTITFRLFTA